jgi:hypothetical protein
MIIQIDPKTRIVGTERSWELQQARRRNGKPSWEAYKWFTTFRYALEEAVHRDIRLHPAIGLSEAIDAVSDIVRKFDNLIPADFQLIRDPDSGDSR